jgi:hypothetical protein
VNCHRELHSMTKASHYLSLLQGESVSFDYDFRLRLSITTSQITIAPLARQAIIPVSSFKDPILSLGLDASTRRIFHHSKRTSYAHSPLSSHPSGRIAYVRPI